MSEQKHTPGPWSVLGMAGARGFLIGQEGCDLAKVERGAPRLVGMVYNTPPDHAAHVDNPHRACAVAAEEDLSNARLIAAAPDTDRLGVLEELLKDVEAGVCSPWALTGPLRYLLEMLTAARELARGAE